MKKNKEKNARNDLASKIIRNRTRGYVTQRSKPFTGKLASRCITWIISPLCTKYMCFLHAKLWHCETMHDQSLIRQM